MSSKINFLVCVTVLLLADCETVVEVSICTAGSLSRLMLVGVGGVAPFM